MNASQLQKTYLKYKIGVSGSALDNNCGPGAFEKAKQIGAAIAREGAVVVTGDTTGIPFEAAKGAKTAGGITIGLSPGASKQEHVKKYKLPTDYQDLVIYTGFEYSGRNLLFIRACDGVIFVCGRVGTLNEFTIAFEDKKPIGILTGTGGITEEIEHILEVSRRGKGKVIYDSDPQKLVKRILELAKKEDRDLKS